MRGHQEIPYSLSNSFSATGAPAHRPDQCSHCRLQQGSGPPAQFPSCLCSKAVHRLQVEAITGLADSLISIELTIMITLVHDLWQVRRRH